VRQGVIMKITKWDVAVVVIGLIFVSWIFLQDNDEEKVRSIVRELKGEMDSKKDYHFSTYGLLNTLTNKMKLSMRAPEEVRSSYYENKEFIVKLIVQEELRDVLRKELRSVLGLFKNENEVYASYYEASKKYFESPTIETNDIFVEEELKCLKNNITLSNIYSYKWIQECDNKELLLVIQEILQDLLSALVE
jgi:hypothetical protein